MRQLGGMPTNASVTARRRGRTRRFVAALLLSGASSLACSGSPATSSERDPTPTTTMDIAIAKTELDTLIDRALSEPESMLEIAASLRERYGAPALAHLIARHRAEVPAAERHGAADQHWRALIDQVAQQRDAHFGGLYWHRDLAQAQAIAAAEGKPVLSLRLLGDLTSEFSCANSRLFRTILYSDPELARWLDDTFVLHWSSERPVPRIAIDFGDGRTLERTITGNSAHFVLDAEGRTIDVIPGLLAPANFRAALGESVALHERLAGAPEGTWAALVAADHDRRFASAVTRMTGELQRVRGSSDRASVEAWLDQPVSEGQPVPAAQAVPMAIGKMKMEAPVLGAAGDLGGDGRRPVGPVRELDELERAMIGERLTGPLALHPNTWIIVAAERPLEGMVAEDQRAAAFAAMQQALRRSVQEDTAKNLLELAPRIHAELARRAGVGELAFLDVDTWLYARVFETPASDPWLGLVDPSVYTGLVAGGLAQQP